MTKSNEKISGSNAKKSGVGLGGLGGVLGLLVTLALSYSGYWYYASYYMDDFILGVKDDLKEKGIHLNYDGLAVKGYPYRFILSFENPRVQFIQGHHVLNWQAKSSELIIQSWNLNHGILLSDKSTLTFGKMGASKQTITLTPTSSRLSVRYEAGELQQISTALEGVQMVTAGSNNFSADQLGFHLRMPDTTPSMRPNEANDLVEPALAELTLLLRGFGKTGGTAKGNVDLALTPRGQVVPLLEAEPLENWRDTGGTIELDSLNILWQNKAINAEGSLTLDENFYPLGALTIKAAEVDPLKIFLVDMGWANRTEANALSAWIKTWGQQTRSDGVLNIPVMIQDGFVNIADVLLGRLGPIIDP
jgi:hypothetical protein